MSGRYYAHRLREYAALGKVAPVLSHDVIDPTQDLGAPQGHRDEAIGSAQRGAHGKQCDYDSSGAGHEFENRSIKIAGCRAGSAPAGPEEEYALDNVGHTSF